MESPVSVYTTPKQMTYELAKQLKDAGFPQKENTVKPVTSRESWAAIEKAFKEGRAITVSTYDLYIPTLFELIEACEPIKADSFFLDTQSISGWRCGYSYVGYFSGWPSHPRDKDGVVNIDEIGHGSTPEEAVAHLWLALNKK